MAKICQVFARFWRSTDRLYCPENPTYQYLMLTLVKDVSDQAIVLRQKDFEGVSIGFCLSKNKTKKISSGIILIKKQSFIERVFCDC
jgi:hypothetical protein